MTFAPAGTVVQRTSQTPMFVVSNAKLKIISADI